MMQQLSAEIESLAYEVIGAAIEVHRVLGPGLLEKVYQQALKVEFDLRGIPYSLEHAIAVNYKGYPVGEGRLDFLVGDSLIVELKAVQTLTETHAAQVHSYLKITQLPLALLLNFNVIRLKDGGIQRIIYSSHT